MNSKSHLFLIVFFMIQAESASAQKNQYAAGFKDGYDAGYDTGYKAVCESQPSGGSQFLPFPGGGSQFVPFDEWFSDEVQNGKLADYLAIDVNEAAGISYSSGAATPVYVGDNITADISASIGAALEATGMKRADDTRVLLVPMQPMADKSTQMTIQILNGSESTVQSFTVDSNDWESMLKSVPVFSGTGVTMFESLGEEQR